ncbi:hypothetical protein [Hoeflea sp.]|uniref:hypothetical protein n=1 Tax=Hoeflea sp. TaxID=1940281 RepID=UPI0019831F61|nr:hypothetical protein [Hoeflea sp.]MBC7280016.1 hypothetical protein [Hoeflea sp.]
MSVRLITGKPMRGFPSEVKQHAIVLLWQHEYTHEQIAAALDIHESVVTRVLDMVRAQTGSLRPTPEGKMR